MPIDNDYYNRNADTWWDESQPLSMLLTGLNPGRFGYFRDVLTTRLRIDPRGMTALDIGCGGGFLAEEFARLGCRVTGVDPSTPTLETARAHARLSGLEIDYRVGVGEALPVDDAGFDLAYCCDVLEHVDDLGTGAVLVVPASELEVTECVQCGLCSMGRVSTSRRISIRSRCTVPCSTRRDSNRRNQSACLDRSGLASQVSIGERRQAAAQARLGGQVKPPGVPGPPVRLPRPGPRPACSDLA